jgi:hypothetical protein
VISRSSGWRAGCSARGMANPILLFCLMPIVLASLAQRALDVLE